MIWTKKHAAEAAAQGWGVFDVWTGKKWLAMALPLQFSVECPDARTMQFAITARATSRDELGIAALRHMKAVNT